MSKPCERDIKAGCRVTPTVQRWVIARRFSIVLNSAKYRPLKMQSELIYSALNNLSKKKENTDRSVLF